MGVCISSGVVMQNVLCVLGFIASNLVLSRTVVVAVVFVGDDEVGTP